MKISYIISVLLLSGLLFAEDNILQKQINNTNEFVFFNKNTFYIATGYSYILSNRTATLNKPSNPQHGTIVRNRDTHANGMLLKAGYQFNKYLAIEGRYTFSIGDHVITDNISNGSKESVDVDLTNLALYIKPIYPIGNFSLYGLLGYGKIDRQQNTTPVHNWNNDNMQWGIGGEYAIVDNYSIFIDYIQWHESKDEPHAIMPRLLDTSFSAVSMGVTYSF